MNTRSMKKNLAALFAGVALTVTAGVVPAQAIVSQNDSASSKKDSGWGTFRSADEVVVTKGRDSGWGTF